MTETTSLSLPKKHEDRISKSPNEILISIISRLTLREATATSLLSSCWRYLHTTYITHLNFPPRSYSSDPSIDRENRSNHVNMVNHVLNSHKGSCIKDFKVMKMDNSKMFKKCFEFALTRKAERIDIYILHGPFPTLSKPDLLHGLKYLKELTLSWIDLTDQDFDLLVSHGLVLESLSIGFCELKNITIVGHSKLKHFGLSYTWEVGSIEIHDVINLVSLKFYGLRYKCVVQLSNIPKLIKLDYEEGFNNLPNAEFFARMPFCIRGQLQLLHLSTCSVIAKYKIDASLVDMSVELVNVKHLELVIDMCSRPCCDFLRSLCCLIDACCSLQKLKIKFLQFLHLMRPFFEFKEISKKMKKLSPKYLKEMEISGYGGSPFELNLALHVVNQARALEKLTVVPCDLNDTVRKEALARAQRDFQHITSFKLMI